MANMFGIRTAWHGPSDTSPVGHAANLHLDLWSPNFGVQEWYRPQALDYEMFPGLPEVHDGYLYPNDQPGLGIDIDEKLAAKYPVRRSSKPGPKPDCLMVVQYGRKPMNTISGMSIDQQFQALTPRYSELAGKVAVVTGGARGIGLGIALRLAREGMRVVIGDINPKSLAQTQAALEKLDVSFLVVEGDLSQSKAIQNLFEQTIEKFGTVDLLVNNAADLRRKSSWMNMRLC